MPLFQNPNIFPHSLSQFSRELKAALSKLTKKGFNLCLSVLPTRIPTLFGWVGLLLEYLACFILDPYILIYSLLVFHPTNVILISLNKQILFLDLAQISTLSGNFLTILSSPSHLFLQEPSSRDRYVHYLSKNNTEDASRFHKWLVCHYM